MPHTEQSFQGRIGTRRRRRRLSGRRLTVREELLVSVDDGLPAVFTHFEGAFEGGDLHLQLCSLDSSVKRWLGEARVSSSSHVRGAGGRGIGRPIRP
ncbi:hypothetical protein [Natronorubrum sp. FCH18a]|uniref:hypothetical protein n=1 Tax=Natronorubrum sp. FCH18a TaxID=3447018 RepID=UPI003F519846